MDFARGFCKLHFQVVVACLIIAHAVPKRATVLAELLSAVLEGVI